MSEGDGPRRRDLCRYPLATGGGMRREVPSVEAEARRLTRDALDQSSPELARRALAVRAEAEVVSRVRTWARPDIGADAGARGPGRGALEAAAVGVMTYSAKVDAMVPTTTTVVRRARSAILTRLPADLQNTAELYEALVAQRAAVRTIDLTAPAVGGGMSDGGAAARCDADARLFEAEKAIGDAVALKPRGALAHADRGRRAITVRQVVDLVCICGFSLEDVLVRHGWSRATRNKTELRGALEAALARMMVVIG